MVTRGGTAAVFRTSSRLFAPGHGRTVAFGRAQPARLTALVNVLAAAHIDEQASCVRVNFEPVPGPIFGNYEVSWFGPDGRENSFQIVFANHGDSNLPDCGSEAADLESAISTFADALAATPATRVCP